MTTQNLGTVQIRCPACGGTQFIQHGGEQLDAGDPNIAATCTGCSKTFTRPELDELVRKIGDAFSDAFADAVRKALKKF
ncbi:ECs_2282 family putative zinc-binding protein [Burkholderia gladioli]|uniref:ECs_2282 family putative zinc-binding protein n=1 Tax=Burkholderia gladioli TaxID=28095 RepID=UPI003F78FF7D